MENLLISIHCTTYKNGELLRSCMALAEDTGQIEGCTSSGVTQSKQDKGLINLEQQWERRAQLNDYFRSDLFSALIGAVKLLGENIEITINSGRKEDGMAVVETARNRPF